MGKMGRKAWYDKNGMKKGAWSQEEDNKLRSYIQKYGHWNWRQLPKFAGLLRCGKSCRLRWLNYLRQNIKGGNFSKEEEDLIIKLRDEHGNKWAEIATRLPGRTDNEVKNYWHSKLKKRVKESQSSNLIMCSSETLLFDADWKVQPIEFGGFEQIEEKEFAIYPITTEIPSTSEGYSQFSESSSGGLPSDINWYTHDSNISLESYSELNENFWTEPLLSEKKVQSYNFPSMSPHILNYGYDNEFFNQIFL